MENVKMENFATTVKWQKTINYCFKADHFICLQGSCQRLWYFCVFFTVSRNSCFGKNHREKCQILPIKKDFPQMTGEN